MTVKENPVRTYTKITAVVLLMILALSGCEKGGIKTETMTPEERAAAYAEAESKKAESESESKRLEAESKRVEQESLRLEAEAAEAKAKEEREEDIAMAQADFEENRYFRFDGVDYELTFYDSFNGHTLDPDKWAYCPKWERDDCIWKSDGTYLEDGNLVLAVTGDKVPYTAGAVRTRDLFEQTYGFYEVRCKLPQAEGLNGAFWLMCDGAGAENEYGGSDGCEIDILEAPHHDWSQIQHALHFDGYGAKHKTTAKELVIDNIYADEYHTYTMVWTPEEYRFFVDGEQTWKMGGIWVCNVPCYLKLSVSVGGWAGELDPNATPVAGLTVDYIKVGLPVE